MCRRKAGYLAAASAAQMVVLMVQAGLQRRHNAYPSTAPVFSLPGSSGTGRSHTVAPLSWCPELGFHCLSAASASGARDLVEASTMHQVAKVRTQAASPAVFQRSCRRPKYPGKSAGLRFLVAYRSGCPGGSGSDLSHMHTHVIVSLTG